MELSTQLCWANCMTSSQHWKKVMPPCCLNWPLSPDPWSFLFPSSYSVPTCLSMTVTSSTTLFITERIFLGSIVFSQSRVSTLLRIICRENEYIPQVVAPWPLTTAIEYTHIGCNRLGSCRLWNSPGTTLAKVSGPHNCSKLGILSGSSGSIQRGCLCRKMFWKLVCYFQLHAICSLTQVSVKGPAI